MQNSNGSNKNGVSSQIGLIACDWNGTLVDDAVRACAATNTVLEQIHLPRLDLDAFRDRFVLPIRRFFRVCGVPENLLERAEKVWNRRMLALPPIAAPGVREFLAAAFVSRVPVGVISAAEATVVRQDAAQLGVLEHLSFVRGSAQSKRDEIKSLVASTPGPVYYLGDTEYDIVEALAAGATPIGVSWGYRPASALTAAGASHILSDLRDLMASLARPGQAVAGYADRSAFE